MAPRRERHGGDLQVCPTAPECTRQENNSRRVFRPSERLGVTCCVRRALLVYCLRHYKGDDKIKSFIWDLISPAKDGQDQTLLNHSGQIYWLMWTSRGFTFNHNTVNM